MKPCTTSAEAPKREIPRTPDARAELEMVGLVAAHPRLRSKARVLLDSDLLGNAETRRLLGRVLDAELASADEIVDGMRETDEQGAKLLERLVAGAPGNDEVDGAASALLSKLKEFATERLILDKKAQMRELDAVKDREAYDELFREIAALQVSLDRRRRGEVDDEEEVWGPSGG